MSEDEIKDKMKQTKGKICEGIGEITGDTSEQLKGKAEQAEGKIQEGIGKATKKRSHSHYHNHDLSDHDHV
jgi:uncharacterized protein YjbJ (UPF0337 family)